MATTMSLDMKKLVEGISLCKKVSPVEKVNLDIKGSDCWISTQSDFYRMKYKVKDCVKNGKDCSFCVSLDTFLPALSRFNEIDFSLDDRIMDFKCGKFKGNLTTFAYEEVTIDTSNAKKLFKFDNLKDEILKVMGNICISPSPALSENESQLEVIVASDGSKVEFLCIDRYHGTYACMKEKMDKFEIHIPVQYVDILSMFQDKFEILHDQNCIYLVNKSMQICLPQIVINTLMPIDKYNEISKSWKSKLVIEDFDVSKLCDAITYTQSVKVASSFILMDVKKGVMTIRCSSELGSLSSKIDVNTKGTLNECQLQDFMLLDVVDNISGKATTMEVFDNFIRFNYKKDKVAYKSICSTM